MPSTFTPGFFSAAFTDLNPFDASFGGASGRNSPFPLPDFALGASASPVPRTLEGALTLPPMNWASAVEKDGIMEEQGAYTTSVHLQHINPHTGQPSPSPSPTTDIPNNAPPSIFSQPSPLMGVPPQQVMPPIDPRMQIMPRPFSGQVTPPEDITTKSAPAPRGNSAHGRSKSMSAATTKATRGGGGARKRKVSAVDVAGEVMLPPLSTKKPKLISPEDSSAPAVSRRGGRRPKSTPDQKEPSPSPSPEDFDDADPNDFSRRSKFLERNRLAASKCRLKKKQWANDLEATARLASQRSRQLQVMAAQLREEVLLLKGRLLAHEGCGCEAIRRYLSREAEMLSQRQGYAPSHGGHVGGVGMTMPGIQMGHGHNHGHGHGEGLKMEPMTPAMPTMPSPHAQPGAEVDEGITGAAGDGMFYDEPISVSAA
ncbi:hypothetical protein SAICODRAFT_17498 [Saitoella complicata NRRL Y-17804]|uniref:uncharacterized protein n=1 Tax=Saitoella complicata (strain BCRC 22490 / CBS 7301 / JCM 7358 / NBRC 10748 / NRRL Y-17804) TaxID=698492 RepID=UPI000866EA75|nr:uncharacterized protein SAICODRAFT_17498 [Saitoella complicata NRRL Y-17804]ODQ55090.1 hypothetical protein SAICODRAFT_17498 [Saitoella complicata NRRL Y-17804]